MTGGLVDAVVTPHNHSVAFFKITYRLVYMLPAIWEFAQSEDRAEQTENLQNVRQTVDLQIAQSPI